MTLTNNEAITLMGEITRVSNNIAAAYTALDGKGATLPETQNSANLADTIDTISTGGGGGETDSDYTALLTRLGNITSSTANMGEYCRLDWYYETDMPMLFGFTPCSNEIWFKNAGTFKLLLPAGATVDTEHPESYNSASWLKITFSGDKYVVYCAETTQKSYLSVMTNFRVRPSTYTQNDVGETVTNIAIKSLSSKDFAYSNMYLNPLNLLTRIKNIYLENITFSDSSLTANIIYFLFLYYGGMDEGIKLFPNIQARSISPELLSIYKTSLGYSYAMVLDKRFTFALDYTGLTTTSYQGITSNLVNPYSSYEISLNVILPDMNWSWTGVKHYFSAYNTDFVLSDESLKFMSDNAPTVSGKTITLNTYCTCASYWLTFKSAMEAKGWTVATS